MATYVLVHGAWHTGAELETTAAQIRAAGHEVHTPTIAGNKPGDPRTVGLSDAIKSIVDYLIEKNLKDAILVGHSYGGMVNTGVADQVPNRIHRLVYWNAFVPNNGERPNDMLLPPFVTLFEQIAAQRRRRQIPILRTCWPIPSNRCSKSSQTISDSHPAPGRRRSAYSARILRGGVVGSFAANTDHIFVFSPACVVKLSAPVEIGLNAMNGLSAGVARNVFDSVKRLLRRKRASPGGRSLWACMPRGSLSA
jgi:pimeloyl-ACP methyl ester carboxylesterase